MKKSKNNSPPSQKLKLICDFGPLLVFFLGFRLFGLLPATFALIVATVAALAVMYVLERRIAIMPLFSGVAVAVFGGITLYLHDETFIKIKPTVINSLFSVILLVGYWRGKAVLKYLLSDAFQLDEQGWLTLSFRWGLFFLFLAGLNEAIWRNFPTEFWVNFKVFGMFTLTMAFTLSQIPLMKRHMLEDAPKGAE